MAAGRLRGLVATASLDLGIDWGDVDLVVQMGAPKGSSRLLQRIGRANHRLDEPSKGIIVPGNRFEYLEARAALDAIDDGELDPEVFRPGALDVLAQHILAMAVAAPFQQDDLLAEVRSAAPYAGLISETFEEILNFIATGGYALKAYDRFRRLVPEAGGMWRIARPQIAQQHRLNAGVIVEQPLMSVRFRNGRKLGTIEEGYASTLSPGDNFYFSGLSLEVEQFKDADVIVHASSKQARIVTYGGQRMSMSTHLANRVRHMLCDRNDWSRFPNDVSEWLEVQSERSVLPEPHQLLVETFPHEGQHFMVAYSFEGWNAHQSLGMLITRRMESAGLKPLGFVANDYALACYGLEPVKDPKALFSADILEQEFIDWVESSYLLKTAFREVAVIGGLVERHHPGKKKSGRQVSFSTDLIYDVLRRYEPQHLLLRAAWDDARRRMTELGRLVRLVDRASATMLHVETGRITPMAVPLMVIVGREALPPGAEADETLLTQAEALAEAAMTPVILIARSFAASASLRPNEAFPPCSVPLAAWRLRRRHRRQNGGRCRHYPGQACLRWGRCRHHQPEEGRREARPRAARSRTKARQGSAPFRGAMPARQPAAERQLRSAAAALTAGGLPGPQGRLRGRCFSRHRI